MWLPMILGNTFCQHMKAELEEVPLRYWPCFKWHIEPIHRAMGLCGKYCPDLCPRGGVDEKGLGTRDPVSISLPEKK